MIARGGEKTGGGDARIGTGAKGVSGTSIGLGGCGSCNAGTEIGRGGDGTHCAGSGTTAGGGDGGGSGWEIVGSSVSCTCGGSAVMCFFALLLRARRLRRHSIATAATVAALKTSAATAAMPAIEAAFSTALPPLAARAPCPPAAATSHALPLAARARPDGQGAVVPDEEAVADEVGEAVDDGETAGGRSDADAERDSVGVLLSDGEPVPVDASVVKGAELDVTPRELVVLTDTLPAEDAVGEADRGLLNDELPLLLLKILWLGDPDPVGRRDRLVEPLPL